MSTEVEGVAHVHASERTSVRVCAVFFDEPDNSINANVHIFVWAYLWIVDANGTVATASNTFLEFPMCGCSDFQSRSNNYQFVYITFLFQEEKHLYLWRRNETIREDQFKSDRRPIREICCCHSTLSNVTAVWNRQWRQKKIRRAPSTNFLPTTWILNNE